MIMNNANIHSAQLNHTSSADFRKTDIIYLLSKHNIPHSSSQKREIFVLVENSKLKEILHKIDTIVNQQGHQMVPFTLPLSF